MKSEGHWLCAQLGAREHYSVPRSLYAASALHRLLTDFWADPLTRTVATWAPGKSTRSLARRFHPDIPRHMVKSWNCRALAWEARLRRMIRKGGARSRYLGYCDVGKRFAQAVVQSIKEMPYLPSGCVFFGYDTCSLEVMQHLKERGGATCILDQIDPCRVEIETVKAEQLTWPGWENESLDVPDEFYERHRAEWDIADRIVVNSEFCRQALVAQDVSADRISVVPLSFERQVEGVGEFREGMAKPGRGIPRQFSKEEPLRVLFLGQVMLRKGIQYLARAAEVLINYPVIFDVVGPINISAKAISATTPNMIFHGRATRAETVHWYRNADVFVLPTLSDGFAITQIEAMANGLPVIATPNCGAVVTDGINGFVVPPRDPVAIAQVIHRYLEDSDCLLNQHHAALDISKEFSLKKLSESLQSLENAVKRSFLHV